jgi:hypothetical protein
MSLPHGWGRLGGYPPSASNVNSSNSRG